VGVAVVVNDDPEEEAFGGGDYCRRGLRKRNRLDLVESMHLRWHWHC
jgi:hypothetical protein